MSYQDALDFRAKLNDDPELATRATAAFSKSLTAVVEFGKSNGFFFTESEAETAINQVLSNQELSDYELELVSAGGSCPTDTGSGTGDTGGS
jgi:predicted ribosomally synthesized peptide with nif11-like leader